MKSSQLPMKVNTPTVTREGTINGRMMRVNMPYQLHPSMVAASSMSRGIPRMNCMIRKMLKPLAKKEGAIIGR